MLIRSVRRCPKYGNGSICLFWMGRQNTIDPVQVMKLREMTDFAM